RFWAGSATRFGRGPGTATGRPAPSSPSSVALRGPCAPPAACIHLPVAVRVLTFEVDPVAAIVPNGRSVALWALGVLLRIQRRCLVTASGRHAHEARELATCRRTFDAQHAFVRVAMREDVERAVPENATVEDRDLFVHPSA